MFVVGASSLSLKPCPPNRWHTHITHKSTLNPILVVVITDLRPHDLAPVVKVTKVQPKMLYNQRDVKELVHLGATSRGPRNVVVVVVGMRNIQFLGKEEKAPPLSPSQIDSLCTGNGDRGKPLIQGTFGSLLISAVHYSMGRNPCFGARWAPPRGLLPLGPNEPTMSLPSFRSELILFPCDASSVWGG